MSPISLWICFNVLTVAFSRFQKMLFIILLQGPIRLSKIPYLSSTIALCHIKLPIKNE
jgi:hypothetical protein